MEEDCFLVEVLEKSLEIYQNQRQIQPTVKIIERKKFFHPHENFICDKCGEKFQGKNAYAYTYVTKNCCGDCLREQQFSLKKFLKSSIKERAKRKII